jgi:hypothetical protein
MRFYTKEWYNLMQQMDVGTDLKKLPDREYTEADLSALYEKKLKQEIARDRRFYNTDPTLPLSLFDDLLAEEDFDPEDWLTVNEDTGEVSHPTSPEEVRAELEADARQAREKFEQRPPFDPQETIDNFRQFYQNHLRLIRKVYPAWLLEEVNPKLMALGYLTEPAYNRFRQEKRQQKAQWNKINRQAKKTLRAQQIPDEIEEAFDLHDAALLSLKQAGKNYQMMVCKDGYWDSEPGPYRRVTFHNATVLEKEDGLRVRKYRDQRKYFTSNTSFLYDEIYRTQDGYEVHMMFWTPKDLAYLTIACTEVTYQDGNTFDK